MPRRGPGYLRGEAESDAANPIARGLVSVHRLVQVITLAQIPAEEATAWRQAAAAVVEAALPDDPEDPGYWSVFAALLPHAQAALDPAGNGMEQLARTSARVAATPRRLPCSSRSSMPGRKPWAPNNPYTLTARGNLATWTGDAGDAAGARDQYAALVPVRERVLGGEHPDTLIARANLAYYTGAAGDAVGARDQYAALAPVIERVLGAEHPNALATRANMTHWSRLAQDASPNPDQARRGNGF